METLSLRCAAKCNLCLHITGTDKRGYHLLESVMQSLSLYDDMCLYKTGDGQIRLFLENGGIPLFDTIPDGPRNLCVQAAVRLFAHLGLSCPGVGIRLTKRIPVQAGLGGGSADAAAVLFGLNRLFSLNRSDAELAGIGASLGADIPFCLGGGTQLALGIGERLSALPPLPDCAFVLIQPEAGASTAGIFSAYDALNKKPCLTASDMVEAVKRGDLAGICAAVHNDLEACADLPQIPAIKQELFALSAMAAGMTGSGSVVFGLFADIQAAKRACEALSSRWPFAAVCAPAQQAISVL